mmetsp:Transcript_62506/g.203944  ORF Transcript_62506/g.203944 Transcript_62506/m.203944 type:complete len:1138 (+) Transcript_62506:418-3831(+)
MEVVEAYGPMAAGAQGMTTNEFRPAGKSEVQDCDAATLWPSNAKTGSKVVTTLVIRGLPKNVNHDLLVGTMLSRGFAGTFDFVYCPHDFDTRKAKGYAFVNFLSADVAKQFRMTQNTALFPANANLTIHPADVQGFFDNIKAFLSKRQRKNMRQVHCLPTVFFKGSTKGVSLARQFMPEELLKRLVDDLKDTGAPTVRQVGEQPTAASSTDPWVQSAEEADEFDAPVGFLLRLAPLLAEAFAPVAALTSWSATAPMAAIGADPGPPARYACPNCGERFIKWQVCSVHCRNSSCAAQLGDAIDNNDELQEACLRALAARPAAMPMETPAATLAAALGAFLGHARGGAMDDAVGLGESRGFDGGGGCCGSRSGGGRTEPAPSLWMQRAVAATAPAAWAAVASMALPPQRLVVIIAGPTAVGKSDVALALAAGEVRGAELISADSIKVYRGLDIGSNKPTAREQARCPTHLIDWLSLDEPCTVGAWTKEALRLIDDVHARGKLPIVVGGSCMYLDWLVHGEPDAPEFNIEVQVGISAELLPFQTMMDWDGALALLSAVDPEKAASMTRTGRASRQGYVFKNFFLCPEDRQALNNRIDGRCLKMLQAGLFEEVARLLERGSLDPQSTAGCAIGYRQVIDYLTRPEPHDRDVRAFDDFLRTFATATRGYARSQVQWFARDSDFLWLAANPFNPDVVGDEIRRLIARPQAEFEGLARLDGVLRERWASQGRATGAAFASCLEFGSSIVEELEGVLRTVDACTRRVPERFRRQPVAAMVMLTLASPCGKPFGKVYWGGRHQAWGWGNPLGKLHKQAVQVLESYGWRRVDERDDSIVPAFCWPTRKAGDFLASGGADAALPLVRPFPQEFTQRLDDKSELAAHLSAAGFAGVLPPTWLAHDFMASELCGDNEQDIWFVKHNLGVKGNGVHVFAGSGAVKSRLEELGPRGRHTFIVQRGVAPPDLHEGRKWMLRAHALLHCSGAGGARAYCHSDMVVIDHGQLYTEQPHVRAAHISSAGNPKNWPKPYLLDCEPTARQVRALMEQTFAAVWQFLPPRPFTPPESELCQVLGFDFAVDAHGRCWLLEVNNYPAIASGTMEHVDTSVYTNLVRDVLQLVVLPRLDGILPVPGGFVELNVEGATGSPPS